MQRKFKRYWKLTWRQIIFPVIFDPRFKIGFVDFRLKQAFGSEAESKIEIVKKTSVELFKDYSGGQEIAQDPYVSVQTNASGRYADWDNHVNLNSQPTNEVPTELEVYLSKQSHTSKKVRFNTHFFLRISMSGICFLICLLCAFG